MDMGDMPSCSARCMTRRETLTREKVLHAAMALVDEVGFDGLSMRRLAAALDVRVHSH